MAIMYLSKEKFTCPKEQRGTCIKGLKWPPLVQKLKFAFHKFLWMRLLEEWLKCKILAFI